MSPRCLLYAHDINNVGGNNFFMRTIPLKNGNGNALIFVVIRYF